MIFVFLTIEIVKNKKSNLTCYHILQEYSKNSAWKIFISHQCWINSTIKICIYYLGAFNTTCQLRMWKQDYLHYCPELNEKMAHHYSYNEDWRESMT